MITAFDAESWGTGGAGAAAGFPLPYIYRIANRRRTHKDVFINTGQQRPMRAPGHPQGSFITEIMMDELADLVKMDPVEFRIKNLPPEAPNAMWRAYLREGADGVRLGQAASDRRPDARADQDRHGRRDLHVGRRRPRPGAGALRDRVRRQRRHANRHAGPRHRHAHARRDGRRRIARPARPSQVKPRSATRCYGVSGGSGGSTTAASISPAIRVAAVKALDALKEKVAPALGVDAGIARRRGRPHPRQGQPVARACRGRTRASRSARSRSRSTATGSRACRR